MKKGKIAFYCSSISWGGLEMNLVRYAGWMQERGWEVMVIGVNGSRISQECAHLGLRFTGVRRNRKYFDLLAAFRLKGILSREKTDLVWFRDNRDLSLMALTKRLSANKIRLIYQQAMQLGVSKKDWLHTLRFNAIDIWISTNEYLAGQVRTMTKFPHSRIHVVPLGTPLPSSGMSKAEAGKEYGIPENATVLGLLGRFDPLKGQMELLEAFLEVAPNYPDLHLLMVGEPTLHEGDEYWSKLKQTASQSEVSQRIHFGPFTRDTRAFFTRTDIFVMASYAETFGMVTIEAMSYGIPVIGTNTAGTPDLTEQGRAGALFEPKSSRDLAQTIRKCLSDPSWKDLASVNSMAIFKSRFEKNATLDAIERLILNQGSHARP